MREVGRMLGKLAAVAGIGFVVAGCMHGQATATTAVSYAKPGFYTQIDKHDGRLWVFEADSEALKTFKEKGEPAKIAIRPGAGPGGITVKSVDSGTIVEYLTAKPGFVTSLDDHGRLWIFLVGSKELEDFKAKGELAKHVIRPAAGPMGLTVKAPSIEVLDAYNAAK